MCIFQTLIIRQFVGCLIFLLCVLLYIHNTEDPVLAKSHLGLACCSVTILFFAAPLASLVHVVRVKSTDSLPYQLIFATFIVSLQWFIYGIVLKDRFIQVRYFNSVIEKF